MKDFYKYADLNIDELNRLTISRFDALKRQLRKKKNGVAYDPLLVTQLVTALYRQLDEDMRNKLYLLAEEQYEAIAEEVGLKELDEGFEDLFLENILSKPDPITRYAYDAEVLRKRDRAIEGVNAVSGIQKKQAELDKAMRFWAQMSQQYMDNAAFEAAVKAFQDAGITYVKWIALDDAKVCQICFDRAGKIYRLDKLPEKPHWRCRCSITPLSKGKNG